MGRLKNALFSLKASGSLSRALTFLRRRGVDIVEATPSPIDPESPPQLAWRHMFNKCVDLWHELSIVERQQFESDARPRHMTGYAWYMSQCLRPNPGIYLPLQGGTMAGDIDMAKHRLLKLPLPTDSQEATSKAYVDAHASKVFWKDASERALNLVNQAAGINWTDMDLTAFTSADASFAILVLWIHWDAWTNGKVELLIRKNGTTPTAQPSLVPHQIGEHYAYSVGNFTVGLDTGQVCEYKLDIGGVAQVDVQIYIVGYIE